MLKPRQRFPYCCRVAGAALITIQPGIFKVNTIIHHQEQTHTVCKYDITLGWRFVSNKQTAYFQSHREIASLPPLWKS